MCPHTGCRPQKDPVVSWDSFHLLHMDRDPSTWLCVGPKGEEEFIPQMEMCSELHCHVLPFSVSREPLRNGQQDSPAFLVDTPDWVEGNSQPVLDVTFLRGDFRWDSCLKKLQSGHPQLVMFVMSNLILTRTGGCAAP